MNARVVLAALGVAVLAGCQGMPVARQAAPGTIIGTDADSAQAVAQRQRIERLGLAAGDCASPAWAMTGRVALSNGKDGGSGRIEWSQSAGKARIELTAPVTRQGWALEVDVEGATLQGVPDGPVRGTDAAALLRERTGCGMMDCKRVLTESNGDMEKAVELAHDLAKPPQVVLLSPACASFDMFDGYEERGRVFKDLVKKL